MSNPNFEIHYPPELTQEISDDGTVHSEYLRWLQQRLRESYVPHVFIVQSLIDEFTRGVFNEFTAVASWENEGGTCL